MQILYHYAPGDAEVNIIVSLSASLLFYLHVVDREEDTYVYGSAHGFEETCPLHYCVVPLNFTYCRHVG